MKNLLLLVFVLFLFVQFGCSSKLLFKENFDSYQGSVQTYPSGPPDEIIKIVGDGSQVPKVEGNHMLAFVSNSNSIRLISDNFNDEEKTKTIYWDGRFSLGDGPMWFIVSAGNSSGIIGTSPHLKMKIWKNEARLEEYISPSSGHIEIKGPAPIVGPHEIFISLRPKTNSYYISISSSTNQTVWTGALKSAIVNQLKNNPRILMQVTLPGEAIPANYYMDNIIMRQK